MCHLASIWQVRAWVPRRRAPTCGVVRLEGGVSTAASSFSCSVVAFRLTMNPGSDGLADMVPYAVLRSPCGGSPINTCVYKGRRGRWMGRSKCLFTRCLGNAPIFVKAFSSGVREICCRVLSDTINLPPCRLLLGTSRRLAKCVTSMTTDDWRDCPGADC